MNTYEFEIIPAGEIVLSDAEADFAVECEGVVSESKETIELARIVRDISQPLAVTVFTST